MPPPAPAWLLLVTNLPGHNPTLRMRIWRALKGAGAGLLRDGAYLLPNRERSREVLEEQGADARGRPANTLLASFDLEQDPGLARLGALVHHIDVGGIPIAEGPGFAAIMAGSRALQQDDDALLRAMIPVLDSLYAGYAAASRNE